MQEPLSDDLIADLRSELEALYVEKPYSGYAWATPIIDIASRVGHRHALMAMDSKGGLTDLGRRAYTEWVRIKHRNGDYDET